MLRRINALKGELAELRQELERLKTQLRITKEDMAEGFVSPKRMYIRVLCRYANIALFCAQNHMAVPIETGMMLDKALDRLERLSAREASNPSEEHSEEGDNSRYPEADQ